MIGIIIEENVYNYGQPLNFEMFLLTQDDEEWLEVQEEEKDYSGLRIQTVQQ